MKVKYLKGEVLDQLKNNTKIVYELLIKDDHFSSLMSMVTDEGFGESKIEFEPFEFVYNNTNPIDSDFDNARILYETFKHISESQAIDERFWVGLSLQLGKKYLIHRWSLENETKVIYRWFFYTTHRRALYYHGLSRLWWYAHLTYDESRKDPYELTSFAFKHPEAILANLIYRNFSNSKSVRFAIFNGLLKFSNSGGTITQEKLKELYKYVSFLGGVTLLDALPMELLEQKIYLKLFDLT